MGWGCARAMVATTWSDLGDRERRARFARWGRLHTGHKVSAALHGGLILAAILFDVFHAPPERPLPQPTEVSLISAAEFQALTAPRPPLAPPGEPAPGRDSAARARPAPQPAPPPEQLPDPVPEPVAEAAPSPAPAREPEPTEPGPTAQAPAANPEPAGALRPAPVAEPAPSVPQEGGPQPHAWPEAPPEADAPRPQAAIVAPLMTPDAALRPRQRSLAERVAPHDAPEPPAEARIVPRASPAPQPAPKAEPAPAEATPPAAPPAAVTETVTEATRIERDASARRTATAPEVSLRPAPRPTRPATTTQPTRAEAPPAVAPPAANARSEAERPRRTQPTPPTAGGRDRPPSAAPIPAASPPASPPSAQPARDADAGPIADAVAEAVAQALAQGLARDLPRDLGPRALSAAELDGLRLAVEQCWNVALMPADGFAAVVTIGFELDRTGRPIPDSIRLVGAEGGSPAAQQAAFRAGQQAILDCGRDGFALPPDLYELWQNVEITFNPSQMGLR